MLVWANLPLGYSRDKAGANPITTKLNRLSLSNEEGSCKAAGTTPANTMRRTNMVADKATQTDGLRYRVDATLSKAAGTTPANTMRRTNMVADKATQTDSL